MRVWFTEQPVRHTASASQSIYQTVDLGGRYRVLDLILSVFGVTGTTPSMTVTIQTSMQSTDDDGWVTLGTFTAVTAANSFQKLSMSGALRYARYTVVISGSASPSFTFDITGYARESE